MIFIHFISFVVALALMPLLCRKHKGATFRLLYLLFCTAGTPILGYPLFCLTMWLQRVL